MIKEDNKIFATQRGYGELRGGWKFPGGKIEKGETPEEALKREIREELFCPFHYFGITELEIDGNVIDDGDFDNIFPFLVSAERVNHIINKIQFLVIVERV